MLWQSGYSRAFQQHLIKNACICGKAGWCSLQINGRSSFSFPADVQPAMGGMENHGSEAERAEMVWAPAGYISAAETA